MLEGGAAGEARHVLSVVTGKSVEEGAHLRGAHEHVRVGGRSQGTTDAGIHSRAFDVQNVHTGVLGDDIEGGVGQVGAQADRHPVPLLLRPHWATFLRACADDRTSLASHAVRF